MRGSMRCLLGVGVLAGAMVASGGIAAAPISAPSAIRAAAADLAVTRPIQFLHLGKPYCWYPYGWAGPGWYWCGYGTRSGLGWGGAYGWNGWVAPRNPRVLRHAPHQRYRR